MATFRFPCSARAPVYGKTFGTAGGIAFGYVTVWSDATTVLACSDTVTPVGRDAAWVYFKLDKDISSWLSWPLKTSNGDSDESTRVVPTIFPNRRPIALIRLFIEGACKMVLFAYAIILAARMDFVVFNIWRYDLALLTISICESKLLFCKVCLSVTWLLETIYCCSWCLGVSYVFFSIVNSLSCFCSFDSLSFWSLSLSVFSCSFTLFSIINSLLSACNFASLSFWRCSLSDFNWRYSATGTISFLISCSCRRWSNRSSLICWNKYAHWWKPVRASE